MNYPSKCFVPNKVEFINLVASRAKEFVPARSSLLQTFTMSFLKKLFGKTPAAETQKPEPETIFHQHTAGIYPWIKVALFDTDDMNETNESDDAPVFELNGEEAPICKTWLGDLLIFYVVDKGDSFQMLLQRDLPKDVTNDELHQLAIDNLASTVEYTLQETNFGGYGLIAGGNHEAGAICLPEIWDWLTDELNDDLIVAIPAKDLVLITPESDTDKTSNLKIFVHEIFKTGDRLLTKNIFRVDKATKQWSIVDRVG
jgi:uncharacterized protein YtpQ (UPF0354 family)